ncbi:MAG: Spy/CpxP family protein refolding chaperone [Candidatus Methylomirabilales bacterium]
MRSVGVVLAMILAVLLALPAVAQVPPPGGPGPMQGPGAMHGHGGMMGGGGMMGPGMMGGGMMPPRDRGEGGPAHEGPLISIMLRHRQELGLTPEQERKLQDLRTEATKDSIRRTAEIRVAEVDLDALLAQDTWDVAAIEAKARQIAGLQADRRVSRLKTLAAGRAVLTSEQLQRLREVGHRGPGGPGARQPGMGPAGPGRPAPGPARP